MAAGSADRLELIEARRAMLDAQRHLLDARGAQWAALAALEDAVQRPLDAVVPMAVALRPPEAVPSFAAAQAAEAP
jgi:outer membrane protein TolC